MVLAFEKAPAVVCEVRGEEYVDEETINRLLMAAEKAARSGVLVDTSEYVAA